jgi:rod shape-determining protein MreD
MEHRFRSILIVLGLLLLQTTFVPLLSLGGMVPDLLLIWVVYTGLKRGQVETTIAGFAVGLLQDLVSTQFFGLAALSKTVAGFLSGYFYNENKTDQALGTYRFLLVVGLCSVAHNILYFLIFLQGTEIAPILATTQFTLATTAYTMAVSALPMFAFSRRLAT